MRKFTDTDYFLLGNGYVGQGVVNEALSRGINVVSVNRSGAPKDFQKPSNSPAEVEWHHGDILNPATYREAIKGADGAVSCVGAFGSNEVRVFTLNVGLITIIFIL